MTVKVNGITAIKYLYYEAMWLLTGHERCPPRVSPCACPSPVLGGPQHPNTERKACAFEEVNHCN